MVEKLKTTKPIPVKRLFTIKSSGKYKGRIVAAGNLDPEKYDKNEKKSPTPGQLTVKWFLAFATKMGWPMEQTDIDSAYLNGTIDREKYIRIPLGFEGDNQTHVGRLNCAL